MARSRKKNAGGGNTTAKSEKQDKKLWHKKMRTMVNQKLNAQNETEEQILPIVKEVSNPWKMDKDGKWLYSDLTEDSLRNEIDNYIDALKSSDDKEAYKREHIAFLYRMDNFLKEYNITNIERITEKQKERIINKIMRSFKGK